MEVVWRKGKIGWSTICGTTYRRHVYAFLFFSGLRNIPILSERQHLALGTNNSPHRNEIEDKVTGSVGHEKVVLIHHLSRPGSNNGAVWKG
jgi:hypothetical protein